MKQLVSNSHRRIGSITNGILSVFYHTRKNEAPIIFEDLKRIIVVDFPMIGDLVMGIPFYKTIRRNCPNAYVTLVCQKWAGNIMREQGIVDDIIEFDGKKILHDPIELVKNYRTFKRAIKAANTDTYDIAIEPRGDIRNIFFMRHIHSEEYISFSYSGGECMLSRVLKPDENIVHILDDKLNVLDQLGMSIHEEDRIPTLVLSESQYRDADVFLARLGINKDKEIIAINPGASLDIKKWKHFPELVEKISNVINKNTVILAFGVNEDKGVLGKIVSVAESKGIRAFSVIENLSLYIALISKANYMICNDSSAGHLAAALAIPVVVIFGPVLPEFAAPRSSETVEVVSKELPCKPCFNSNCPTGNECIEDISLDEVERAFYSIYRKATD